MGGKTKCSEFNLYVNQTRTKKKITCKRCRSFNVKKIKGHIVCQECT